jgi:nitrate reductase delta subunit
VRRDRTTANAATWQIASVLLGYPDEALSAQLPTLAAQIDTLPPETARPLTLFLEHAQAVPTLQLAQHFVETFDLKRRCCLYLTYYAHGDTRQRGVALLEFKSAYRRAGLELGPDELPDHLAVVLEYAALDPCAGRTFWLNPEPRLYWNYGDSVIAAYEEHCEAFECWTTTQLEDFVKALTRPVTGR